MAERRIVIYDGEKKVYEGPENRHHQNVAMIQSPKFLGLSPDTWIKIAGFILAAVVFYVRTDDFMKSQLGINKYIMDFAKNSDTYHSASTGRVFEQGKPMGWGSRAAYADEGRNNGVVSRPSHGE